MADTEQNKTEAATPFKLKKARERGNVARGGDLGFFAVLTGLLLYVLVSGSALLAALSQLMQRAFSSTNISGISDGGVPYLFADVPADVVAKIAGFAGTIVVAAVVLEIIQLRGITFSAFPLKPDFSRLDPGKGLKRLFSVKMLKETLKNVAKLAVYSVGAALVIHQAYLEAQVGALGTAEVIAHLESASFRLLVVFVVFALVFAAIDQVIVRQEFARQMRMSKSELTREYKEREGEPRIKRRRKQLHAEFTKQARGLGSLKGSDLIIVNPTHFAVALRYDAKSMNAPQVTAKGRNQFAFMLKRQAHHLGIPIFEAPPLARALYRKCDIGREVPEDEYRGVVSLYLKLRSQGLLTGVTDA